MPRSRTRAAVESFIAAGGLSLAAVRFVPDVQAAGSSTLKFQEVVEKALARSPGLQAAESARKEAAAGWQEARASRLPTLQAREVVTRGDNPVYAFGSLLEQGRFGTADFATNRLNHPHDLTNWKSRLELGIPLFTGFDLTHRERLARIAASHSDLRSDAARQQLAFDTGAAYLQALASDEILRRLDDRIASAKREVDDARRLKDRGVVLGSDFYAAEAIFASLQAWRTQLESERAALMAQLSIRSGLENGTWTSTGTLRPSAFAVEPLLDLVSQALANRPDLRAASQSIDAARVARQQSASRLLPRVDGFAAVETNTKDFGSNPTNHLFGLSATLPFGDPAYLARRRRTAAAEETAKQDRSQAEEQARLEVSNARAAFAGARDTLPLLQNTMDRANQSLTLVRPLYRSGRQSLLEVLRAEEGLVKAEAAYLDGLCRLYTGYLRLKLAAGRLDVAALSNVSQRLEVPR